MSKRYLTAGQLIDLAAEAAHRSGRAPTGGGSRAQKQLLSRELGHGKHYLRNCRKHDRLPDLASCFILSRLIQFWLDPGEVEDVLRA